MGVQIFGGEPALMAEAARVICQRLQPDFLDINYGCPAPKVVRNACGSSLLRDLPRMGAIAGAVVRAVGAHTPVTAKIRLGWDAQSIVALEAGRILESEGVEVLTIHGRTKAQGYAGGADWDRIAEVAAGVRIPVVGNGSVDSPSEVQLRRATTGVRGLMVGRAALGYPWLFREIRAAAAGLPVPPPPSMEERWSVLLRYACELMERPAHARRWDQLQWMRPRLKTFTKLIPGCRRLRLQIETVRTFAELEAVAAEHLRIVHSESEG